MGKKRRSGPRSKASPGEVQKTLKSRFRRKLVLLLGMLLILVGGLALMPQSWTFLENLRYGTPILPTTQITLPNGKKLDVEIARSAQEQEIGLMFRKALAPNRGMIFVYTNESVHTFWMKNTLIDLDMVFIGANKRVTSVAASVPKTTPETPDDQIPRRGGRGQYILEIPAGRAKALGIEVGTLLSFNL